jgi:hypothetical protein
MLGRPSNQVSDNRHSQPWTPADLGGSCVPGQACCSAGSCHATWLRDEECPLRGRRDSNRGDSRSLADRRIHPRPALALLSVAALEAFQAGGDSGHARARCRDDRRPSRSTADHGQYVCMSTSYRLAPYRSSKLALLSTPRSRVRRRKRSVYRNRDILIQPNLAPVARYPTI